MPDQPHHPQSAPGPPPSSPPQSSPPQLPQPTDHDRAIAACEGTPAPTDRDRENAAARAAIAARQATEYGQLLAWALGAFGPGWEPSGRHYLVSKEEEDRCRHSGERPAVAATVFPAKNELGEARHFTVDADGRTTEHA